MPGFLSFTISESLHKLMSIESMMPYNHLILCHPLLLLVFSSIRVFSKELALCIRRSKRRRFFYNPMNVDNLFSSSSVFSKSSLYIWNFSVHVLLKPSLKDFEHAHIQRRWRSCSKMVGGAQLSLKSNPTPARVALSAQTKPCVPQNPGKGAVHPTRD